MGDVGAAVFVIQRRWRAQSMARSLGGYATVKELTKGYSTRVSDADPELLNVFQRRRDTFGDITQGFSDVQLAEALQLAGNDPKVAIRILQIWRGGVDVYQPKAFIKDGKLVTP